YDRDPARSAERFRILFERIAARTRSATSVDRVSCAPAFAADERDSCSAIRRTLAQFGYERSKHMNAIFRRPFVGAVFLLMLCAGIAAAHHYSLGGVQVMHPWSPATSPG